jgi:hypothetical protein
MEHMLGIISLKLRINDTNEIASKMTKAGITDWKRLALTVKNKELWSRFDISSSVKSLLEDIYERGSQVADQTKAKRRQFLRLMLML